MESVVDASRLLDVRNLCAEFVTPDGTLRAVDGVSFTVEAGKTLCIVGESGCGKSVTCLAIMGLLDRGTSTVSGEVLFRGREILNAPLKVLREIRGNRIAMISQDPMTSLNPVHRIGVQLVEAVRLHSDVSKKEARSRAVDVLRAVGIADPQRRIDDYPHQFSGGMRQRVMIATALINSPDLIIADEPTTALDVTTQAQILALLRRLQRDYGTAIILVTHDLGVVAESADDVAVMYASRIVERGSVESIFANPRHPYTWGLLGSLPRLNRVVPRLPQIPGQPPSLLSPPPGCRFHPRCKYAMSICSEVEPTLSDSPDGNGQQDACHLDEAAREAVLAEIDHRTQVAE
jgi:peptide/nickel transport system ATP-binding protein